jgi:hypothetical protein
MSFLYGCIRLLDFLGGANPNKKEVSRPISRVLSRVVIHLGGKLPFPSCDHTRGLGEQRHRPPIRSCSGWGLPGQPVARPPVVSYTTFSPLPRTPSASCCGTSRLGTPRGAKRYIVYKAVCFCGTFPKVTFAGRYPAPCSVEPGLSSGAGCPAPATT